MSMTTYEAEVWYEATKDKVGGLLASEATRLLNEDQARLDRLELNQQLYGGTRARAIRPWQNPHTAAISGMDWGGNLDKLRLNVVKAAVDTITAKVGKIRPRPTFLTNGGQWSLQRRAKNLQRFMDGAYHQSDVYELAPDVFRDAMVDGTGVIHPYTHGSKLRAERVPSWELFVDRADALYGKPRCLHRTKWVACNQIRSMFPSSVDPKADPASASYSEYTGRATEAGYVRVVESWCLPTEESDEVGTYDSRKDTKDYGFKRAAYNGRHVVLCGAEVMCDEDYPCEEFPFVFLHWSKPKQGFWGDSAVQEVMGLQVEINKLLQFIAEAMQKTAQPFIFKHKDAVITPAEVTNLIAGVYEVSADVPLSEALQVVSFQSVHPQVMQHLWMLYSKAFEILGSNQLAASASAPPGLESGRALEQLSEEHSERFMTVSRHYEYVLGEACARQFIRCAKEIDARLKERGQSKGFVIKAPNGRAAIDLKWDEVEIDSDGYVIQVFPTSVLPTTPAARIQEVERMAAAGWIDASEARRMLDFPDMQAANSLATADEDNLMRQLEMMLEEGKPVQVEPYQDIEKAIRKAQQAIMRAQVEGAPEENIDLVRDFIVLGESLLKRTQTPNAAIPSEVFQSTQQPGAVTASGNGIPGATSGAPPTPQG